MKESLVILSGRRMREVTMQIVCVCVCVINVGWITILFFFFFFSKKLFLAAWS